MYGHDHAAKYCFARALRDLSGANEIPDLKVAEMLHKISRNTKIIFLSEDRDYALAAYQIGAYRYICCPLFLRINSKKEII